MAEVGLNLAKSIVDALEEKKGEDILLLDLIEVCSFTDYFVICTGTSERMLKGLADEVTQKIKKTKVNLNHNVEGDSSSGWILIDVGDVIVHIFSAPLRKYFQLEELWREGKVLLKVQ